jgi:hypothetical protein
MTAGLENARGAMNMTICESRKMHHHNAEAHVLSQIVDAILEAESALERASIDEWKQILTDSCRRRKKTDAPDFSALGFTC